MANGGKNLFSDQDFEKTPNKNKSKKPLIYGGILAGLIAVGAISYGIWGGNDDDGTLPNEPSSSLIADSTTTTQPIDTIAVVAESETEQKAEDATQETKEVKEISASQNVQKSTPMLPESVKEAAASVIRGNFGNNPERRRKLGDRYQEIQSKVNEMYRNGEVR